MRRALAAGALVAAAIVTAVAFTQLPSVAPAPSAEPSMFAGAYHFGTCAETPTATWSMYADFAGRRFAEPSLTVVVGGRLATQPMRNLSAITQWWVADVPRESIHLRATRLDRDAPTVDLVGIGRSVNSTYPDGFDRRWMYVMSAESAERLPTSAGCWKIALVEGDPERDVIVIELRGVIAAR